MESKDLAARLSNLTKQAQIYLFAAAREYIANPDNNMALQNAYINYTAQLISCASTGLYGAYIEASSNTKEKLGEYLYILDKLRADGLLIDEIDTYSSLVTWKKD